ncbi:MAG: SusC/RagA family TonB-linked outer membrane protein [Bacteroidia bacterium]|nr:SusC/RagA family TonB-linked outer membrane protein [Bacteroidia bacterium]
MLKKLPLLLLLQACLLLAAQPVVTGTITSAADGTRMQGVAVAVKSTPAGALSDAQGTYRLTLPPGADTLVFSFIGFEKLTVALAGRTQVDVSLQPQDIQMDEVVIAALGIERETRALGYAVQEISAGDFDKARETNFIQNLSGRVAGLNVTATSSGIAGSSRVTLRGERSLDLDANQPLFVVDGLPITNNVHSNGGSSIYQEDLPVDFGNGAAEINPDDIESVTVLKGASAAALYGSRAANGVILITTKSGKGSPGIRVSYNTTFTRETVLRLPEYQNVYGAGLDTTYYSYYDGPEGPSTADWGENRGPRLALGKSYIQYGSRLLDNGEYEYLPWEPQPSNVRDYFQAGFSTSNNLSVSGSSDNYTFRLSYTNFYQAGMVPNTNLKRNYLAFSSGLKMTDKLRINASFNYLNSGSDNLQSSGYGAQSVMYSFIWWERQAPIDRFRSYWVEGLEGVQQNYHFSWADNPFLIANEHINSNTRNRVFGNVAATYQITPALSFMLRAGTDFYNDLRNFRRPWSTVYMPKGRYREQRIAFQELNTDFLLTYNKAVSDNWKVTGLVGGNRMRQESSELTATAWQLSTPGVYSLNNAEGAPQVIDQDWQRELYSLYGLGQLAFKEQIFLEVTGRNDWSSTLPPQNNAYFYPSASLSTVLSDMFRLPEVVSFAKWRASWGRVGNDADPERLISYYNTGLIPGSVTNNRTLFNTDLKPEQVTSVETGLDLRLFKGRLTGDLTFYRSISRNQILETTLSPATGADLQLINAGKISNWGTEVTLSAYPFKSSRGLTWEVTLNHFWNRSKVLELAEGVENHIIAEGPDNITVEARVGGRMGDMYGEGFVHAPDGQIVHEDGLRVIDFERQTYGNYLPDWQAGLLNSFSYRNVSLSFLIDHRQGGIIYSYTHVTGNEAGSLVSSLPARVSGFVSPGVIQQPDGSYTPNDVSPASDRDYYGYTTTSLRPNLELNSFDATYTKLRQVILGYTLPEEVVSRTRLGSVSFSLVGRNLLLLTRVPNIDPETSAVNGGGAKGTVVPGMEVNQLPSARSFGATLNLTF